MTLTKGRTRGTSQFCPRCGKRLQEGRRDDPFHRRQLWCPDCQRWMDRDVVAVMNVSMKGRAFLSNDGTGKGVFERPQGPAGEAMVQEPGMPVILKVDAGKLSRCQIDRVVHQPKT